MADYKVAQSAVMQTANTLDDLKHQAVDVLNRYYQHAQDLQAQQGLNGTAGTTNVVTAEEIQHAQMKIQTRWEQVIQLIRSNVHGYADRDHQNASHIGSVAGGLRWT
jgi:hypothetical protein